MKDFLEKTFNKLTTILPSVWGHLMIAAITFFLCGCIIWSVKWILALIGVIG